MGKRVWAVMETLIKIANSTLRVIREQLETRQLVYKPMARLPLGQPDLPIMFHLKKETATLEKVQKRATSTRKHLPYEPHAFGDFVV